MRKCRNIIIYKFEIEINGSKLDTYKKKKENDNSLFIIVFFRKAPKGIIQSSIRTPGNNYISENVSSEN